MAEASVFIQLADTRTQRPVDPALCERESRRLQNR
jgi:hypothetical protein